VYNFPNLTYINFDNNTYTKNISIGNCPSFSSVSIESPSNLVFLEIYNTLITTINLTGIVTLENIYLNNNAINQAGIDNVLITSDISGVLNGSISSVGGTNAAPSATGLAAKASLLTKGWYVITN
jgi:hypothetical protein